MWHAEDCVCVFVCVTIEHEKISMCVHVCVFFAVLGRKHGHQVYFGLRDRASVCIFTLCVHGCVCM